MALGISRFPLTLRVPGLVPVVQLATGGCPVCPLLASWTSSGKILLLFCMCAVPRYCREIERLTSIPFSVKYRPHSVALDLSHPSPACIDEEYPITIEVTNTDAQELEILVDILLQPTEVDDAGKKNSVKAI